ncbi:hypothetical protein GKQ23_13000 [Erwinia sp. E602]|uniref:hypothetical protein n=1 Tax=Erwinia sp. E602 TaxID=2675378 RepID=UPI001BA7B9CE|nr:hypothetical protein [Erwinia sp. E602]QUG75856.1 hypothetical protein GKQ23_13000 [Erwinia sp. E602]
MSQGLQCWDENAQLVVDLTDYSMRYMGTINVNITATQRAWTVPFSGMRPTGWLVVHRTSNMTGLFIEFYAIPATNQFEIRYLQNAAPTAQTLVCDVYSYDTGV